MNSFPHNPVPKSTRATLWLTAVCILAGCAVAGAAQSEDGVFHTTISPVTEAQHGQWNVALAEFSGGRVLAIWEAGHTEVKTPNVIMSSLSEDGGRTWSERREFYRRPGMRCTPCGFYRVKDLLHCVHAELPVAGGKEPCRVLVRASSDGGASWSEAREIWRTQFGVAMQPVVLRDGRIALPVYYRGVNSSGTVTSISRVLVSKDDGATWQEGANIPADLPGGAMEPALAETSEGDWLCIIRTRGTGWLYASRSKDSGLTWATPAPLPLESPESIARLQRLDNGSLLVVWNGVASKTQGPRNRLTVARSVDGGRTWPQRRDLVQGGPVFSNHGVMQTSDGRILVGYQNFHRDPVRAPERSGVDSVEIASFDLPWLAARVEMAYAVDRNSQRPVPVVTAHGHCAWPNLKLLKDRRTLAALIFNDESHGHHPGDIECWLSSDGGATWKFGSAATQHEPDTIRMNHAAGLAANGDLIVLTSGWSNRWPPNVPRARGSFRYEVLGPWLSRSPDGGKSWWVSKDAFPQTVPSGQPAVPFGDVQIAQNGDLCVAVYSTQGPWEKYEERKFRSWLYRSKDDGKTWGEPVVIGPDANETTPLHVGNGRWLAAARIGSGVEKKDQMLLYASTDDGRTWTFKRTMTGFQRVNGHLAKLRDGRVLFSCGDRASDFGKKGLEAMMSADGGETWTEPVRLIDWNGLDGGYPSSVQRADGQIVTAYYASALPGDPPNSYKNYHMAAIVWDPDRTFPKR